MPSRREHVEEIYAVFAAGRLDELTPRLDPAVEFINPEDAVETGTRRGSEALIAVLGQLHELFEYDSAEIVEWAERGDRALAIVRFRGRGRGSGAPMDQGFAHLLEFRGERVLRLRWFHAAEAGRAALADGA